MLSEKNKINNEVITVLLLMLLLLPGGKLILENLSSFNMVTFSTYDIP